MQPATVLELFAGAGGLALGLEAAGFTHLGLVDSDSDSCATLSGNRPAWPVTRADVRDLKLDGARPFLLAAGMPRPDDNFRDISNAVIRIIGQTQPTAVIIENVADFLRTAYRGQRADLLDELAMLGYKYSTRIVYAAHFGIAQRRPRAVIVAFRNARTDRFSWPIGTQARTTVGAVLREPMGANGWPGHNDWATRADGIGPTIIGGSRLHGGPDLGPTGSRRSWMTLGVDGTGIADEAPDRDTPYGATPRLTLKMVAALQGFNEQWQFEGSKSSVYRQIAGALPSPVGQALGTALQAVRQECSQNHRRAPTEDSDRLRDSAGDRPPHRRSDAT